MNWLHSIIYVILVMSRPSPSQDFWKYQARISRAGCPLKLLQFFPFTTAVVVNTAGGFDTWRSQSVPALSSWACIIALGGSCVLRFRDGSDVTVEASTTCVFDPGSLHVEVAVEPSAAACAVVFLAWRPEVKVIRATVALYTNWQRDHGAKAILRQASFEELPPSDKPEISGRGDIHSAAGSPTASTCSRRQVKETPTSSTLTPSPACSRQVVQTDTASSACDDATPTLEPVACHLCDVLRPSLHADYVTHRFWLKGSAHSPIALPSVARESIRAFSWHGRQIIWVDTLETVESERSLFPDEPIADVTVRSIFSEIEETDYRYLLDFNVPVQHAKDFLSVHAVNRYHGRYADMKVIPRKDRALPSLRTPVVATEPVANRGNQTPRRAVMLPHLSNDPDIASARGQVWLGYFSWSSTDSRTLKLASAIHRNVKAHADAVHKQRRKRVDWTANNNQWMVNTGFLNDFVLDAGTAPGVQLDLLPPLAMNPFPPFLATAQQLGCVSHGYRIPTFDEVRDSSENIAVTLWSREVHWNPMVLAFMLDRTKTLFSPSSEELTAKAVAVAELTVRVDSCWDVVVQFIGRRAAHEVFSVACPMLSHSGFLSVIKANGGDYYVAALAVISVAMRF